MPWMKILLAYDGSECSQQALAAAISLAKAENAALIACVVVDPIEIASAHAPATPNEAMLDEGRARARALAEDAVMRARKENVNAEALTPEGEPAYEIVQAARRSGADAIVMGTHGRSGVKRLFLGSVAEATLRASSVPVVVVHQASAAR
jgi:nucleotide-binding universal stress UspA family protein